MCYQTWGIDTNKEYSLIWKFRVRQNNPFKHPLIDFDDLFLISTRFVLLSEVHRPLMTSATGFFFTLNIK